MSFPFTPGPGEALPPAESEAEPQRVQGGALRLLLPEAGNGELAFELLEEPRGEGDEDKIVDARHNVDFRGPERTRNKYLGLAGKLDAGDDVGEGGIFDQINDFVAAAGQGAPGGSLVNPRA